MGRIARQKERVDGGPSYGGRSPLRSRTSFSPRARLHDAFLPQGKFFKHLEQHSELIIPPTLNSYPLHECLLGEGGAAAIILFFPFPRKRAHTFNITHDLSRRVYAVILISGGNHRSYITDEH